MLYRRLAGLDPEAAGRIDANNARRIIRAVEVCEGSGRPFSSFGPGLETYPASSVVQIGLRWERSVLTSRITERVHGMIDRGLVGEVAGLMASGLSRTAGQALGYKELLAHLDGELSLDESVQLVIQRTRQFAVRQLRWFQRDPRVRWVDIEHDPVEEAAAVVRDALNEAAPVEQLGRRSAGDG